MFGSLGNIDRKKFRVLKKLAEAIMELPEEEVLFGKQNQAEIKENEDGTFAMSFDGKHDKEEGGKVIKTFPLKAEWKKEHTRIVKRTHEVQKETKQIMRDVEDFWEEVEAELGCHPDGHYYHYNEETNEIQLIQD